MTESRIELLTILIVSYNTRDRLRCCLRSIEVHSPSIPYEVIVVDNASPDGSADQVATEFPKVRLIRSDSNDGYGVAINRGVLEARGSTFLFLNPDMEVCQGSFDRILRFQKEHPRAGVVGPRLVHGDGRPQSSTGRTCSSAMVLFEAFRLHLLLPQKWRGRLMHGVYLPEPPTGRVGWISGACHLIPREVWENVGPLTEETFCGFDDYDYCFRVRQCGYEVWICADAVMIHHTSTAVRRRWTSWEVEQVAVHNTYIVLGAHWPRWRVRIYQAAELIAHVIELLRQSVRPRQGVEGLGEPYGRRILRRLRFTWNLLSGSERPVRRFQALPCGSEEAIHSDVAKAGRESAAFEKAPT